MPAATGANTTVPLPEYLERQPRAVETARSCLAYDALRGIEVAAKWASGKGELSALANEWQILHRLRPGRFARPVEYARIDDRRAWMTTRRVDAVPMAECEGLTATELIRVAFDALSGLAALHRAGYVHGDVRPQNLLIRSHRGGPSALWIDLEHAVPFDQLAAGFSYVSGWHASHLERGQPQTPRADLAALGRLLAERAPVIAQGETAARCLAQFASELMSENPISTLLNGDEARYRLEQLCAEAAILVTAQKPAIGPPVFITNRAAQRWWRTSWSRWQASGHPRVVRLSGVEGCGKSSFLRAAAALAALDGHRVLDLLPALEGDDAEISLQPDWTRGDVPSGSPTGTVLILLPAERFARFLEHAATFAGPGTIVVVEGRTAADFEVGVPHSWQLEECTFPPFSAREWFQWVSESF